MFKQNEKLRWLEINNIIASDQNENILNNKMSIEVLIGPLTVMLRKKSNIYVIIREDIFLKTSISFHKSYLSHHHLILISETKNSLLAKHQPFNEPF